MRYGPAKGRSELRAAVRRDLCCGGTMKTVWLCCAVFLASSGVLAQSSVNFQIGQATLNCGGHPSDGVVLSATTRTISLDSIGEGVVARSLSSASFRMDAGLVAAFRPPGEIAPSCGASGQACLRVQRSGPTDVAELHWPPDPSVGTYNVYRGLTDDLAGLGFGSCNQTGLVNETALDAEQVAADHAFFYLVTARNRLDEEGTKGFKSNGAERLGTVCP